MTDLRGNAITELRNYGEPGYAVKTIAFAQQKGGVGKSTLAINTAVELSRRKHSVSLIDADQQGTVTKWKERRHAEQPTVINGDGVNLLSVLDDLESKGTDFALLDLPGRQSSLVNLGMQAADFIIIPARPLDVDVEASVETVRAARRLGKPYAFALAIIQAGSSRTKEFAESLREKGQPVLPAFVATRMSFPDAIMEGLGVVEFEPKGKAAAEIVAFTNAVLESINR